MTRKPGNRDPEKRTVNCEHFESLILDLAYGELPASEAEELRLHAAGCPGCRDALQDIMWTRKLAAQLPLLEPNTGMDAAILDAARARIASIPAEKAEEKKLGAPLVEKIWKQKQSVADRLRSLLLAPALATAALACLVLVLSIFLSTQLNKDNRKNDTEIDLVGETVEQGAKESTASTETSAEGQVAHLRGAGTSESFAGESFATAPPVDSPGGGSSPLSGLHESNRYKKSSSSSRPQPVASLGTGGPAPKSEALRRKPVKRRSAPRPSNSQFMDDEFDNFAEPPMAPATAPSRAAGAPSESLGVRDEKAKQRSSAGELAESEPLAPDDFQKGMEAYARGDCARAIKHLKAALNESQNQSNVVAGALLHIARCEKRQGRFGAAVPWYDKFLTRFPSHRERVSALREAAACHRRLGHIDRANSLLDELSAP